MEAPQRENFSALQQEWRNKMAPDRDAGLEIVAGWKSEGQKIVFTNGCFDLLHPGHLRSLMEARSMGDKLVLGLNSDASVRALKGPARPVNPIEDRMKMLAALSWVDLVIPFEESTPAELIQTVLPDVLVKGGDYEIGEIAGADAVLKSGGRVYTLGFAEGYSSSKLIEKIKAIDL